MGPMFCRKCGKELPGDSKFCLYCGEETLAKVIPPGESPAVTASGARDARTAAISSANIAHQDTKPAPAVAEKPPDPSPPQQASRGVISFRWIAAGVIVILVIVIIGGSTLFATNAPPSGTGGANVRTGPTVTPTPNSADSFWVRHTPPGFQAGFSNTDQSGSGTLLRAEIGFFPQSGPAPLTVRFTDKSRGFPSSWSWDFGDGLTSSDENPVHTYTSAGTYFVDLTISGDGVQSSTRAGPFIVRAPGSGGGVISPEMSEQIGRAVLKYTNTERAKRNLPPLTWNPDLALVAKAHSELMASTGMLSHLLPGEMPLQTRLIDGGVPNAGAGENLAMVESGSDPDAIGADCVYGWVWDDAPENWGHRHNILDGITSDPGYNDHPASDENPDGYGNSGYRQMGAGAALGTVSQNGKTYTVVFVTQDFLPG